MNLDHEFDATLEVNRDTGFRKAMDELQAALDDLAASQDELRDARRLLDEPEEAVGLRLAVAAGNVAVALLAAMLDLSKYNHASHGGVFACSTAVALAVLTVVALRWRRASVLV